MQVRFAERLNESNIYFAKELDNFVCSKGR